jgi:hypothetical protein
MFAPRELNKDAVKAMILDMTAKTGGIPHYVAIPLSQTIAIGVSLCADRSFSLVASYDQTFARYVSEILPPDGLNSGNVRALVEVAAGQFADFVQRKPTLLIVYVNEGCDAEQVFEALPDNFDLILCTVEKVPTIRLYTTVGRLCPPPGTVTYETDDGRSFHLPTETDAGAALIKFTVVHERLEREFRWDRFATISFWLTFNFPSGSHPSANPAPVMAAIAQSEYAGQYLKTRPASPHLQQLLYYLS